MSSSIIQFFNEDISYSPKSIKSIKNWLFSLVSSENAQLSQINYIFCSDEFLLNMNREYLDHDYYTDIITFPYSESKSEIEADIFISVDRVRDNAKTVRVTFSDEMHRVLAHGILHLLGYNDSTDSEKAQMRKKEEHYLSLRDF